MELVYRADAPLGTSSTDQCDLSRGGAEAGGMPWGKCLAECLTLAQLNPERELGNVGMLEICIVLLPDLFVYTG